METRYNVTGEKRKEMVEVISGVIGMKAVYMRMPTCAYVISNITVSKDGTLAWDERTDSRTVERVKEALAAAGFTAEETTEPETEATELETEITEPETETTEAAVSLPMEGMTAEGLKNLIYLLHSKQYLINHAFSAEVFRIPAALVEEFGGAELSDTDAFLQVFQKYECRGIGFAEGKVAFTLPVMDDTDMVRAFTQLAAAMAQQAKEQKRIRPDETIEENEKYYMRIWLLRLGFGGAEGKEVRNLLLKNLKGNAAFRTEAGRERWKEARRSEKEAARQTEQEAEQQEETEKQTEQDAAGAEVQDSGTEE